MRSPVHAMLWETWRVTRVETAAKLAMGIAGGVVVFSFHAAFALPENLARLTDLSAVIALLLLILPHFAGWISPVRHNGGKPGFPLHLLYTRPVRTSVLVGVPLAYLTAVPAAIYLVSALSLRVIFDYPFPLLPVAAWIAILNLLLAANYWSARRMIFAILGTAVACATWFVSAQRRLFSDHWDRSPKLTWPTMFDVAPTDYALIALIGLAAFGVVVARVSRQRHGDAKAPVPVFWTPGAGFPGWLVNLFRIPCPTSSATRAQLWFDLKSTGLPVVTIGVVFALLSALLIAASSFIKGAIDVDVRPLAALFTMAALSLVLFLGGNAFGVRRKQGRTYASAFEATQPYGTAQLAALKILVRSAGVLAALFAIGVSMWTSLSSLSQGRQRAIEGVVATLGGYELLALAFVVVIGVVAWVAASAVLAALRMRHSRGLNVAALVLLPFVVLLALMAMSNDPRASSSLGRVLRGASCAAAVPMVFFTIYLLWSGFAERLLTLRYVFGAVAISAAFGAAWVTVLHTLGVQLAGMPAAYAVSMLSPALLLFTLSVLAPSALDSMRSPSGSPTKLREPAMNDLELAVALARAPSSAFAELRDSPRFWFPLLLVVLTSAGLAYWYYGKADIHLIPAFIFIPLLSALQAWYFLLAAKLMKLPLGFKHWFALTCWCSLPSLLGAIVSAVLLLLADTPQAAASVLNPLSLNALLFHVGRGDPGYELLEMLGIPFFLGWALTLVAVRAWSQRSWAYCAAMFLLPTVATFGIWTFLDY